MQLGWRIIKEKEFFKAGGGRVGKVVKKLVFVRYRPYKGQLMKKAIELESTVATFCCDPKMATEGQGIAFESAWPYLTPEEVEIIISVCKKYKEEGKL